MSQPVRRTLATLATLVAVLALGLVAVAFGTSALDGSGSPEGVALAATTQPPAPSPKTEKSGAAVTHVRLVIDYGDGVQKHFVALDHRPGMTVLDALLAARAHARGILVEHSGSGATALVRRIDDLKNQGGAGEGRNWQFWVNDTYATAGAGATKLEPGDVVRWVFAPYTGGR